MGQRAPLYSSDGKWDKSKRKKYVNNKTSQLSRIILKFGIESNYAANYFNWFENYCRKYSEKLKEHKEKADETD